MTSEGIFSFVWDSGILLSGLQLVSVECDTVKEVFRSFRQRKGQYFACGQISVESIELIDCSEIVQRQEPMTRSMQLPY